MTGLSSARDRTPGGVTWVLDRFFGRRRSFGSSRSWRRWASQAPGPLRPRRSGRREAEFHRPLDGRAHVFSSPGHTCSSGHDWLYSNDSGGNRQSSPIPGNPSLLSLLRVGGKRTLGSDLQNRCGALEAAILINVREECFPKILPRSTAPSRSAVLLMVAPRTPLPAGPPSLTGASWRYPSPPRDEFPGNWRWKKKGERPFPTAPLGEPC